MKIKKCVGAIIYNELGEIFLMTSLKWKGYVIPGGEIMSGEGEEEALKREIIEELGIEISDIIKVGEKFKPASKDFFDKQTNFYFIDFIAKAKQTNIKPNLEIKKYGWYSLEEALKLLLIDSTRDLIEQYIKIKN